MECPEEYNSLCKRIWLRLIVTSKPYLSTFTHIYPYTMTRIKPATPIAKEQKVDLLFPDTDVKLLSPNNRSDAPTPDIRTPSAPSSPALLPRTASPKLSLPPLDIPLSLPDSSAFTFSGMELPLSLRSLMSSQLTKSPARSASHSPKRSATSPRYSAANSPKRSAAGTPERGKKRRRGSLTSGTFNVKSIHWDDDELVVYGQEKVFSLSGYQLQMISLLGILYAACRLLRMRFVARDFELCEPRESLTYSAAVDGVIPYVHCLAFLSHDDLYVVWCAADSKVVCEAHQTLVFQDRVALGVAHRGGGVVHLCRNRGFFFLSAGRPDSAPCRFCAALSRLCVGPLGPSHSQQHSSRAFAGQ